MLDDWIIPVFVVSLTVLSFLFFSRGKTRDKSIFTKPTNHTEIKSFKRFEGK